jgi:hypothetical protein
VGFPSEKAMRRRREQTLQFLRLYRDGGLTIAAIAEHAGVSPQHVWKVLNGSPEYRKIKVETQNARLRARIRDHKRLRSTT